LEVVIIIIGVVGVEYAVCVVGISCLCFVIVFIIDVVAAVWGYCALTIHKLGNGEGGTSSYPCAPAFFCAERVAYLGW
jgi:hypothetical protein